jgi:hypothetical protein
MNKSRFSEQQIAFILKQAEDGTTVEEVCRKAGISIQTPAYAGAGSIIDGVANTEG